MAERLRPRAFLSYRHVEHETGEKADALNQAHRDWVERFAADLEAAGVDVAFDGQIRELFKGQTTKDPYYVEFLAEASTIACLICNAFLPILTPSYIERLGYGGYESQPGTTPSFVLEEWQLGCHYANVGAMQFIPIVRAGEPERMEPLPLGVHPDTTFDMRDPAHYAAQIQFIAQRIHRNWDGEPALITVPLADWMRLYVDWCRETFETCAATHLDSWRVDLVRPRLFLAEMFRRNAERLGLQPS